MIDYKDTLEEVRCKTEKNLKHKLAPWPPWMLIYVLKTPPLTAKDVDLRFT
jgi:hypothetical protein